MADKISTLADLLSAWEATPAAEYADAIATVPMPELDDIVEADAHGGLAELGKVDRRRDPRVAAKLVSWVADPPWHATGAQPFYRLLFERLEAIADPRSIDGLAKAAKRVVKVVKGKTMQGWLVTRAKRTSAAIAATYPDGIPKLTATEKKAIPKTIDPSTARPKSRKTVVGDELLAAIYANPSDDATRQVYADLLSEKGDPRGAFITMQLARVGRDPTTAERKDEEKILAKHAQEWLGDLAGAVPFKSHYVNVGPRLTYTGTRFERGFIAGAEFGGPPKRLRKIVGTSLLATVEALSLDDVTAAVVLEATPLPALRLLSVPPEAVEKVLASPIAKQLEVLEICGEPSEVHRSVVDQLAGFPILRQLGLVFLIPTLAGIATAAVTAALAHPTLPSLRVVVGGSKTRYDRDAKTKKLVATT